MRQELLEKIRSLKEYVMSGKHKSFQYVSSVFGISFNPFVDEEARNTYFNFEQAKILDILLKRP